MTGPEHYLAAEVGLWRAEANPMPALELNVRLAAAQVHATLALAAATAAADDIREWRAAVRREAS